MSRARSFAAFWWAFLFGDDWRLTTGILVTLAATMLLKDTGVPAWWLPPLAVALLLADSLRRAIRQRDARSRGCRRR